VAGTVRLLLWAVAALLASICFAAVAAAPASAGPYVNPTPVEIPWVVRLGGEDTERP